MPALTDSQKAYQRHYYAANREKRLAASLARQSGMKDEKSKYDKLRRATKKDEIAEYEKYRSRTVKRRVAQMYSRAKERAKKRNLPFNIEISDIVVPEFCPALGIKLDNGERQGGEWNSPSLDRLDNNLGYVKGNIQVISKRANSIKSDASVEELMLVAKWVAFCLAESLQERARSEIENAGSRGGS